MCILIERISNAESADFSTIIKSTQHKIPFLLINKNVIEIQREIKKKKQLKI